MAPPKSSAWKWFAKLNENTVTCRICSKQFKFSGNTTNLLKHLKQHPSRTSSISPTEQIKKARVATTVNDLQPSTSQVQIPSAQEVKIDTSKVTTHLRSPDIASAFKTVSSFSEGGARHSAITNSILFFIIKDKRPFHVVAGEGFQRLIKQLAPAYKIPSTKKFKALLDTKYDLVHRLYVEKFQSVGNFSITCDVWSEMMCAKSFLGVTAHYVDGTSLKCVLLSASELSGNHTGPYLKEQFNKILSSWKIAPEKIVAVVTDNAPNMIAAISNHEHLGKNKRLPCFAHTINLVAEAVLKDTAISPLICKVRELVKWVKRSVVVSDALRMSQMAAGIEEGNVKKLIMSVATRWNSTYYMVVRFIEMYDTLIQIIIKTPDAPAAVNGSEMEDLQELVDILKPLEFITTELSGENYVTISKVIPLINCCKSQVTSLVCRGEISKQAKNILLANIEKRFGVIEECLPIAIATLLDPRFKNIHFTQANSCAAAISALRRMIQAAESSSDSDESSEPDLATTAYDFWSHHRKLAHGNNIKKKEKADEVSQYLRNSVAPLNSDPLSQWEDMKTVFPNLYKEARKFMCVMATSVPCERLFSKAGVLYDKARNRLLGKRMEKLLILSEAENDYLIQI